MSPEPQRRNPFGSATRMYHHWWNERHSSSVSLNHHYLHPCRQQIRFRPDRSSPRRAAPKEQTVKAKSERTNCRIETVLVIEFLLRTLKSEICRTPLVNDPGKH